VSIVVAIVQFSGNRPVIDIKPDGRHREPDDWIFILRVRNGTSSAIQIRGHRSWHAKAKVIAPANVEDMAEQMVRGTINFWLEAGNKADLALIVKEKRWLILTIRWRRLSGLHFTSLLPLFVVMSPNAMRCLKRTQMSVHPLGG
jgi:hypothetical protein